MIIIRILLALIIAIFAVCGLIHFLYYMFIGYKKEKEDVIGTIYITDVDRDKYTVLFHADDNLPDLPDNVVKKVRISHKCQGSL